MRRSAWWFVPVLYFQQGMLVILVQQFSVLMYKRLGVPNDRIALWTSLITWPWVLKMLWAPMVDSIGTKRRWVYAMQALALPAIVLTAVSLASPHFLALSLAVLFVTAFFSATHDIALDGFYLLALRREEQAFFAGIRSTFFRLGWVFASGALVVLAGLWERAGASAASSWRNALLVAAGVYGLLLAHGAWATPRVADDGPARAGLELASFADAFRSFFARPKIWTIVGFILLYRFGEAMLTKLSGPFLMDARAAGGLGLDTVQVGNVVLAGTVSLLGGGVLGGYLISLRGLRRLVWAMAVVMNLPNLLYVWLAYAQASLPYVYLVTVVEQFGYGFGLASLLVYMMYVCRGSRYATSHYAIASALLAFGAMLAGIASGLVQKALGYPGFFVVVCAATIPGMLLLRRIPLEEVAP